MIGNCTVRDANTEWAAGQSQFSTQSNNHPGPFAAYAVDVLGCVISPSR
jgi:hypothetical protein